MLNNINPMVLEEPMTSEQPFLRESLHAEHAKEKMKTSHAKKRSLGYGIDDQ
jgi:hypothetical protein